MADHKTLADLRKCMKTANGNQGQMDICEQAFVAAGGTVKADVTLPQGKVFSVPNESEKAFVTNDGKVF